MGILPGPDLTLLRERFVPIVSWLTCFSFFFFFFLRAKGFPAPDLKLPRAKPGSKVCQGQTWHYSKLERVEFKVTLLFSKNVPKVTLLFSKNVPKVTLLFSKNVPKVTLLFSRNLTKVTKVSRVKIVNLES